MKDGIGYVQTVVVAADTEDDKGLAVGTRHLVAACRRVERMDVRGTSPSDTPTPTTATPTSLAPMSATPTTAEPDHARDRSSVGWPRRMPFQGANRDSHRRGWSHGTRWIRDARGCGCGCGSDDKSSLVHETLPRDACRSMETVQRVSPLPGTLESLRAHSTLL